MKNFWRLIKTLWRYDVLANQRCEINRLRKSLELYKKAYAGDKGAILQIEINQKSQACARQLALSLYGDGKEEGGS